MSTKIIHHTIAQTAKAIAAEAYELLAKENAFYAANPSLRNYVRRAWKDYIPYARQSLVGILAKDFAFEIAMGTYTPQTVEMMKNDVYECLLLDGEFKAPAQGYSPVLH